MDTDCQALGRAHWKAVSRAVRIFLNKRLNSKDIKYFTFLKYKIKLHSLFQMAQPLEPGDQQIPMDCRGR